MKHFFQSTLLMTDIPPMFEHSSTCASISHPCWIRVGARMHWRSKHVCTSKDSVDLGLAFHNSWKTITARCESRFGFTA